MQLQHASYPAHLGGWEDKLCLVSKIKGCFVLSVCTCPLWCVASTKSSPGAHGSLSGLTLSMGFTPSVTLSDKWRGLCDTCPTHTKHC